jgi:hypothetical protein
MTLRSVCHSLLALNVLYCSCAFFLDDLPGWKMFESVEPFSYRLSDARGQTVDVHDYLPDNAHLIDPSQLRRVVQFIRTKEVARGPWQFEIDGVTQP